jgi:hypothetical protein
VYYSVKKFSKEKRTKKKGIFQQPKQAISRINDGPCARGAVFMPRNHSVRDIFAGIFSAGIFALTKYQFFKWNLRLLLSNRGAQGDQRWKYNLS